MSLLDPINKKQLSKQNIKNSKKASIKHHHKGYQPEVRQMNINDPKGTYNSVMRNELLNQIAVLPISMTTQTKGISVTNSNENRGQYEEKYNSE